MNDGPPKKTNDAVSVVRGSSVAGVAVRLQQQHSHLLCARPGGASPVCHGDFDRKGFRQDHDVRVSVCERASLETVPVEVDPSPQLILYDQGPLWLASVKLHWRL